MEQRMSQIELSGYVPGALGRITELHGTYYHAHWDLGLYFEAKVATELAAFLNHFDAACDGIWLAREGEKIVGAVVIDDDDLVGRPRLRTKRMKARREIAGFVVRADDDAERQLHIRCPLSVSAPAAPCARRG
jgi:hypothetical protein